MTQRRWRTGQSIALAVAALLPAQSAMAELGGFSGSIPTDQARMHASLRQVTLAGHVRHELSLPNGAVVHEYTDAQGQVFAVRWSGPGKPDLRRLLGSHFDAFQAANAAQSGRAGRLSRRPMTLDRGELQIVSAGYMGYFWGMAWLPALLPAGVSPEDLQ